MKIFHGRLRKLTLCKAGLWIRLIELISIKTVKSYGKNIVIHGDKEYETGLRKIGAIVGDWGDCGCNAVLNPGTIIGKHTQVYPLTRARGVYPENSIVKDTKVFVDKR